MSSTFTGFLIKLMRLGLGSFSTGLADTSDDFLLSINMSNTIQRFVEDTVYGF